MAPDARDASDAERLVARVAHVLDALTGCIGTMLADARVSAEHALHIVVMDPFLERRSTAFESAILAERSIGEPDRWQADYAHYARAKARLAWREGVSTDAVVENAPAR